MKSYKFLYNVAPAAFLAAALSTPLCASSNEEEESDLKQAACPTFLSKTKEDLRELIKQEEGRTVVLKHQIEDKEYKKLCQKLEQLWETNKDLEKKITSFNTSNSQPAVAQSNDLQQQELNKVREEAEFQYKILLGRAIYKGMWDYFLNERNKCKEHKEKYKKQDRENYKKHNPVFGLPWNDIVRVLRVMGKCVSKMPWEGEGEKWYEDINLRASEQKLTKEVIDKVWYNKDKSYNDNINLEDPNGILLRPESLKGYAVLFVAFYENKGVKDKYISNYISNAVKKWKEENEKT